MFNLALDGNDNKVSIMLRSHYPGIKNPRNGVDTGIWKLWRRKKFVVVTANHPRILWSSGS